MSNNEQETAGEPESSRSCREAAARRWSAADGVEQTRRGRVYGVQQYWNRWITRFYHITA